VYGKKRPAGALKMREWKMRHGIAFAGVENAGVEFAEGHVFARSQ